MAPDFDPLHEQIADEPIPYLEWPTLILLVACHLIWLLVGVFLYPVAPLISLVVLGVCIALHSSLQHEALHGHPSRNAVFNEALVFLPLGLFYPYRSYQETHLQHHSDDRLTDPYDDPESYYLALGDWLRLPTLARALLTINNTVLGRVLLGPPLNVIGFTLTEWRAIAGRDHRKIKNWTLHLIGFIPVFLIIEYVFVMEIWLYALTSGYLGLALIAVRSYCEHQWSEDPNGRTIIVERSVLAPLFLYNNLHIVHHRLPWVPWYRLPAAYKSRREEWRRLNGGYVFSNYLSIVRSFAFRPKEPVIHPALRVEAEADKMDAYSSRLDAS
ncbi:fatty acid desaturase [Ochrobactrum sp. S46]|nr:fatty acid desaturase [Ochrobactrum sp. S45]MBK0046246.1 fatty acid desaturase [Ochrobactrum sp. S46]